MGNQKSSCLSNYLYCIKQDSEASKMSISTNIDLDLLNKNEVEVIPSEKYCNRITKDNLKEEDHFFENISNNYSRKQSNNFSPERPTIQNYNKLLLSSILEIKDKQNFNSTNTSSNDKLSEYEQMKNDNLYSKEDSARLIRIEKITNINRVKKLQRLIRQYLRMRNSIMHRYTYDYESKSSFNNVSFVLKDDKSLKSPPDLYVNMGGTSNLIRDYRMSANNCDIKSLKNANSENKSIKMKKSKYNVEDLNNSDNLSKNLGLSCKYYKLKYDNEQIKAIKRYIEKNKFKDISKHNFGIKVYNNKSTIIGFFNLLGQADGLAIYQSQNSIIYKGKFV